MLVPGSVPYDWEGVGPQPAPATVAVSPRTGRESAHRKYYTLATDNRIDPTVKRWGGWVGRAVLNLRRRGADV